MGTLDFADLEFCFLGPDAALVLGHWHLKREKDELGGVFSLVWQRFPEGWRIIHDHTSASAAETNSK
jgi:beta-aspartyl-peptidase (threonine type)